MNEPQPPQDPRCRIFAGTQPRIDSDGLGVNGSHHLDLVIALCRAIIATCLVDTYRIDPQHEPAGPGNGASRSKIS